MRSEGTFPGRLATFTELRTWVEAFGAAAGADHDAILRLVLVLEELFTNTVVHGYGTGSEGPVWVALASRSHEIEVTYEDAGPAFDPLAHPETPLAERADAPPGGLGLALVRGLCRSVHYARANGRNRITLTMSTGDAPHPG